jgi:hypothetical protein
MENIMISQYEVGTTKEEIENELLTHFGHVHMQTAIEIITSGIVKPEDITAVQQAMCIVLAVYGEKIKQGIIEPDRVLN